MAAKRRPPKDKKTGLPKAYLAGAKNKAAKASEIKRTAALYRARKNIDIAAVSKSRTEQGGKTKSKTTKRRRKGNAKKKG